MSRADGDIVITVGGDVSPLTDAVTKAERTLGKLNTATQRADKQFRTMVGSSSELQTRINALTGFSDRLGKSAEKSAAAFENFDKSRQAVDRLRASYDPLFAASKRYEAAVEQLDDALRQGVLTQQQYATMTEKLGQSMLSGSTQTAALAKGTNALQYQVQNASYQVGDFFVQIASGTAASRALAQQLPQLLGGFGMWGAIAGAAAAIGGALVPALIGATEKAKTAKQAVDGFNSSMGEYIEYLDRATASTEKLIEQYGSFAGRIREISGYMSRVALGKALDDLDEALSPIRGNLEDVAEQFRIIDALEQKIAAGGFAMGPEFDGATVALEGFNHSLGSRLIDFQSQNITVAASATADRKVLAHLS